MAEERAEESGRAAVRFRLDRQALALPLAAVLRAIRTVAFTPLPGAPAVIAGLIELRGEVLPVVDLRLRLGLPARQQRLEDQILIARSARRRLALPVDRVEGVVAWQAEDWAATGDLAPGTKYLRGIVKGKGDLILVHDLDALLSLAEEEAIDEAIRRTR